MPTETCDRHDRLIETMAESVRSQGKIDGQMSMLLAMHERMDKKLEVMSDRQISYMDEIKGLKIAVSNGLTDRMNTMNNSVTKLEDRCKSAEEDIKLLNTFQWFRNWANAARDNLWVTTFKFVAILFVVLVAINVSDELVVRIIRTCGFGR